MRDNTYIFMSLKYTRKVVKLRKTFKNILKD